MREITKLQALNDLCEHMDTFLENFDLGINGPHFPPDVTLLMAKAAFHVIEILRIGQDALEADGLLKGGEE
ncbi:MAG: hypothetical protein R2932_59125 [Caldilineaceae bacterium]